MENSTSWHSGVPLSYSSRLYERMHLRYMIEHERLPAAHDWCSESVLCALSVPPRAAMPIRRCIVLIDK
jgi:hypothetical protein